MDHLMFKPHDRLTITITFEGLPPRPEFELANEVEQAIVKLGYQPEHYETTYCPDDEGGRTFHYNALREPPKYGEDRVKPAWRPEWLDYDQGAMMSACKALIIAFARAQAFGDSPDEGELRSALQDAVDAIPGYFENVVAATHIEAARYNGDAFYWHPHDTYIQLPYAVVPFEPSTHQFRELEDVEAGEFMIEALDRYSFKDMTPPAEYVDPAVFEVGELGELVEQKPFVPEPPHLGRYYAIDDVACIKWADEMTVAYGCDATVDVYYGDTCIGQNIAIECVPSVFKSFGDRMSASD